ncbi:hypothetical protein RFI_01789 [Reticulomyxa filosa]|uniref:Uncharacterized protein n=1 Tax=Reticulomyxa filosa TaxID=46433 RepID=X6PAX0_RETFI|nr:hypothetical protein RFI_01789 [Reticulomyxa filosa]|eukprot:ETO35273.1 hypothetical protein RFI_01789 [Reticulomyxa filosa]
MEKEQSVIIFITLFEENFYKNMYINIVNMFPTFYFFKTIKIEAIPLKYSTNRLKFKKITVEQRQGTSFLANKYVHEISNAKFINSVMIKMHSSLCNYRIFASLNALD